MNSCMADICVSHSRVIPFASVYRGSSVYCRDAREIVSEQVKAGGGQCMFLIHPGFFTLDREGAGGQVSFGRWEEEVWRKDSGYSAYRGLVEEHVRSSSVPLFIFQDAKKPPAYEWVLSSSGSKKIVLVETYPDSPLPVLDPSAPFDNKYWDIFGKEIKELGVKTVDLGGEYLYYGQGERSGCVGSARAAMFDAGITARIIDRITYPYGITFGASER